MDRIFSAGDVLYKIKNHYFAVSHITGQKHNLRKLKQLANGLTFLFPGRETFDNSRLAQTQNLECGNVKFAYVRTLAPPRGTKSKRNNVWNHHGS